MNFNRLIYIREENELTQREMAKELNVSKSTYARWETGESIIPLKHLVDLCNKSNLSLDYVLGLTNTKEQLKNKIVIDRKRVGKNLKQFRKLNNLTQTQLASELNTTHSTISAYESGKTLILTSFAYYLASKYKLSVDWLITNDSE